MQLRDGPGADVPEESEPLDCDEAAYAYIGRRLVAGDVLYRDLTENKPPLGYGIYAAGVAVKVGRVSRPSVPPGGFAQWSVGSTGRRCGR